MIIKKKKRKNKNSHYYLFLFENDNDFRFWINYYESVVNFFPDDSYESIAFENIIKTLISRTVDKYKTKNYIYSSILYEEEMEKFINIYMQGTYKRFQYEINEKIKLQKRINDLQKINNQLTLEALKNDNKKFNIYEHFCDSVILQSQNQQY